MFKFLLYEEGGQHMMRRPAVEVEVEVEMLAVRGRVLDHVRKEKILKITRWPPLVILIRVRKTYGFFDGDDGPI